MLPSSEFASMKWTWQGVPSGKGAPVKVTTGCGATPCPGNKLVPLMVISLPTRPLVTERPVITGDGVGITVKLWSLVVLPRGVVTVIGPLIAPKGTATEMLPSGLAWKLKSV
jgi:hypothetical protein